MDTNLVADHVVLRGGNAAMMPTGRLTLLEELLALHRRRHAA
jgi:hypothetical protein